MPGRAERPSAPTSPARRSRGRPSLGMVAARRPIPRSRPRRGCAAARGAIRPGARARSRRTRARRVCRRRTGGTAAGAARGRRRAGPVPARTTGAARRGRWCALPASDAGQVHGPHVLLVGVREARPGVDRRRRRRTAGRCGRPRHRRRPGGAMPARRRHLACGGTSRGRVAAKPADGTQPARLPVRCAQCGGERRRCRDGPPLARRRPGTGRSTRYAASAASAVRRRRRRPAGPTAPGRCPRRARRGRGRCARTTMR